jgi:STE24 endopeptidase
MSWARATVTVAVLALLSAGVVALAARAPAALRRDAPGPGAADPARGDDFGARQIERGRAFNRPGYLSFLLSSVLGIALLLVLARGPFGRLTDRVERLPGGWVAHALALGALVAVLATAADLPLGYVRGYALQHAWGLSTQDVGGWLGDVGRSTAVSATVSALTAAAFFAVVRWQPKTWWLWGWAAFSALTILFVLLWPVAIAPLFNRFTPLDDRALTHAIVELARRAGVDVDEVLVADASRRSRAENAYVAGLGATKRLVLFDTLLRSRDERQTLWVVAHELGHAKESHVLKGVALASAGLGIAFAALAWLSRVEWVWRWAGAEGVADLRAIPALLLFATAAGLAALPVQNTVSRAFEARADAIATELTHDRDAGVGALRRLALSNIADLRPPRVAVLALYSHPPIPERIRAVAGAAP